MKVWAVVSVLLVAKGPALDTNHLSKLVNVYKYQGGVD